MANILSYINKLKESITDKYKAKAYARSQPIASDLSPCARETALGILHWRLRPLPDQYLMERFERGNEIERAVKLKLMGLGVHIAQDVEPFELKGRNGSLICRGQLDGYIRDGKDVIPFEIKSLNPNLWSRIDTADDFNRWVWSRKYPRQLQAYLIGRGFSDGLFILDDCCGHLRFIPVEIDYAEGERIMTQCEIAVSAVNAVRGGASESEVLPSYCDDKEVCLQCWCRSATQEDGEPLCDPFKAERNEDGLVMLPMLENRIAERDKLADTVAEYDRLDKAIKDEIKARCKPGDVGLAGDYIVHVTEHVKHHKAKEAHESKSIGIKIEKIGEVDNEDKKQRSE